MSNKTKTQDEPTVQLSPALFEEATKFSGKEVISDDEALEIAKSNDFYNYLSEQYQAAPETDKEQRQILFTEASLLHPEAADGLPSSESPEGANEESPETEPDVLAEQGVHDEEAATIDLREQQYK